MYDIDKVYSPFIKLILNSPFISDDEPKLVLSTLTEAPDKTLALLSKTFPEIVNSCAFVNLVTNKSIRQSSLIIIYLIMFGVLKYVCNKLLRQHYLDQF